MGRVVRKAALERGKPLISVFPPAAILLAHLSRRLIGELIVYEGIRRPSVRRPSSVRPSVVCQHFQTTSPLKP